MSSLKTEYLKKASIILLLLLSVNAIIAGVIFIVDPAGTAMGLTVEYIRHSPFNSYLLPGIVLLLSNGILPLFVTYKIIKADKNQSIFILLQGAVLMGWILIQISMVREVNWLHIAMLTWALLLFFLGILLRNKVRSN